MLRSRAGFAAVCLLLAVGSPAAFGADSQSVSLSLKPGLAVHIRFSDGKHVLDTSLTSKASNLDLIEIASASSPARVVSSRITTVTSSPQATVVDTTSPDVSSVVRQDGITIDGRARLLGAITYVIGYTGSTDATLRLTTSSRVQLRLQPFQAWRGTVEFVTPALASAAAKVQYAGTGRIGVVRLPCSDTSTLSTAKVRIVRESNSSSQTISPADLDCGRSTPPDMGGGPFGEPELVDRGELAACRQCKTSPDRTFLTSENLGIPASLGWPKRALLT
jgi:hypothetical protein